MLSEDNAYKLKELYFNTEQGLGEYCSISAARIAYKEKDGALGISNF